MKDIIFIADGRDFHALDWCRTIAKICVKSNVYFATDILNAEGRGVLIRKSENIINLFIIDKLLFSNQTTFGNVWRNFIKLVFFPVQVFCLRRISKDYPGAIFHAHTMYYLFIAWLAGVEYIGSPQGDEILIRPYNSSLYYFFAKKSLKHAKFLIVDSENLRRGIFKIAGREADVIQYGIDVNAITKVTESNHKRFGIVSIRAWYPLYRIAQIIKDRNEKLPDMALTFFFPFSEDGYAQKLNSLLKMDDIILGRLSTKNDVYKILAQSELAISIPESDSSPRSVYEAIFCGCPVAVTYNPWIESLPMCMRERIIVVEIETPDWINRALEVAKEILNTKYTPSVEALEMFDQEKSMLKVANKYYN